MRIRLAVVASVPLSLGGCIALPIPHDRVITPPLVGTIVESKSGAPIAGARIMVIEGFSPKVPSRGQSEATSDEQGRFSITAYERGRWYTVVLLAPFEGLCTGNFTVSHERYKTVNFKLEYFGPANMNGVCPSRSTSRVVELEPLN